VNAMDQPYNAKEIVSKIDKEIESIPFLVEIL